VAPTGVGGCSPARSIAHGSVHDDQISLRWACPFRVFSQRAKAESAARDRLARSLALYEFACQRASYEPLPPEMMKLLRAISESPREPGNFAGLDARTVRYEDSFHPDHLRPILAPTKTKGRPNRPGRLMLLMRFERPKTV